MPRRPRPRRRRRCCRFSATTSRRAERSPWRAPARSTRPSWRSWLKLRQGGGERGEPRRLQDQLGRIRDGEPSHREPAPRRAAGRRREHPEEPGRVALGHEAIAYGNSVVSTEAPLDFAQGKLRAEWRDLLSTTSRLSLRKGLSAPRFALRSR